MIDNCKNIFFDGHEPTAITLSWCLMLLALHQDWQDRVRAEVLQICGNDGNSDASLLKSMKTVCFSQSYVSMNIIFWCNVYVGRTVKWVSSADYVR
jgi:cytochrome P450